MNARNTATWPWVLAVGLAPISSACSSSSSDPNATPQAAIGIAAETTP